MRQGAFQYVDLCALRLQIMWNQPSSGTEPLGQVNARMETTPGNASISVSQQQAPKKFAPVVAPKPKFNPYKGDSDAGETSPLPPPPDLYRSLLLVFVSPLFYNCFFAMTTGSPVWAMKFYLISLFCSRTGNRLSVFTHNDGGSSRSRGLNCSNGRTHT